MRLDLGSFYLERYRVSKIVSGQRTDGLRLEPCPYRYLTGKLSYGSHYDSAKGKMTFDDPQKGTKDHITQMPERRER